ncbi:MAG TPA: hydroxymethylbilane synthase [Stellaceae bacterium]|nr:hydroxymethylbilane synthase [Stellaceae bacterium]
MASPLLRIGTRASPLARAQTEEFAARLAAHHAALAAPGALEIVALRTSGDSVQDRTLAEVGGKGLFTKELEEALLAGTIDAAVHSLKDVPTCLPEGLVIACHLPREDPRDAFISMKAPAPAMLPRGAVVGTASLRRQAQLLHARPDLRVVTLRGNVETRLRKLAEGVADATLLAVAGLNRLKLAQRITSILSPEEMLPAPAQGVIAIECREGDRRLEDWLTPLDDRPSREAATAERALLAALDGSCRTPIAALAEIAGETITLTGLVIRPDGSERHLARRQGRVGEGAPLGTALGEELRRRAGPGFMRS